MPFIERKQIILGFSCVDEVIGSIDEIHSKKTLQKLSTDEKIDIFANGGDRKNPRIFLNMKFVKIR